MSKTLALVCLTLYLVVDRSKASPQTLDYIGTLPLTSIANGDGLEVYAVRGDPP